MSYQLEQYTVNDILVRALDDNPFELRPLKNGYYYYNLQKPFNLILNDELVSSVQPPYNVDATDAKKLLFNFTKIEPSQLDNTTYTDEKKRRYLAKNANLFTCLMKLDDYYQQACKKLDTKQTCHPLVSKAGWTKFALRFKTPTRLLKSFEHVVSEHTPEQVLENITRLSLVKMVIGFSSVCSYNGLSLQNSIKCVRYKKQVSIQRVEVFDEFLNDTEEDDEPEERHVTWKKND
jgi:hypothetical protein